MAAGEPGLNRKKKEKYYKITSDNYEQVLEDWSNGKNLERSYIYHISYLSEFSLESTAFEKGVLIQITRHSTSMRVVKYDDKLNG
jgi:hypothetical protein